MTHSTLVTVWCSCVDSLTPWQHGKCMGQGIRSCFRSATSLHVTPMS